MMSLASGIKHQLLLYSYSISECPYAHITIPSVLVRGHQMLTVLTTTQLPLLLNMTVPVAPKTEVARPSLFPKTRHSQISCSHATPKTATIPSGTYESYTASRIGIRTTLSRLTYAS